LNPKVTECAEGEDVRCSYCGGKAMPFMYPTKTFGDYDWGIGCPDCGRKEY